MSYPVIILGAGASHDYSIYSDKMPLTDELVEPRFFSSKLLNKYKDAGDLLSEVATGIKRNGRSFEEQLFLIKNEVGNKNHRINQLIALSFYLKDLFQDFSREHHELNNYSTLFNKIRDYCDGNSCIIDFNYDTHFEQSVANNNWNSIKNYINGSIKLIKPHGSCSWSYIVGKDNLDIDMRIFNISNEVEYLQRNPNYIEKIRKGGAPPYCISELENRKNEFYQFPAIAIPLPEKQDFVCPSFHIDVMKEALKNTDRILIIGWRAGDPHLIELMQDQIKQKVLITIVDIEQGRAREISEKLKSIDNPLFKYIGGGFSKFVSHEICKDFFNRRVEELIEK